MRTAGGFLSLALAAVLMVGCSDSPTSSPESDGTSNVQPTETETPGIEMYRTVLTGAQEVPAVETMASGSASFHMSSDGTALIYSITVGSIRDVTDAHIHLGGAGVVGPPIVDLFDGVRSGAYNGLLVQGRITADDLVGPLAGMTMADLHQSMSSGQTYVNVHTLLHPSGEIRGQVTTVVQQPT